MTTSLALLLVLLVAVTPATAHTGGTAGFAVIDVDDRTVTYSLTLASAGLPPQLAADVGLALRGVAGGRERVLGLLAEKIAVSTNGRRCRASSGLLEASAFSTETVTVVLELSCPEAVAQVRIQDDIFDVLGRDHHTLAKVQWPGATRSLAFTPDSRVAQLTLGPTPSRARPEGSFLVLGIEHILGGYDHLLFLLALLAGAPGVWSILKIVTAFTLAHSVTLALAVLGVVTIPSRVVEPAIAASIVWVALENVLFGATISRRWVVSFLFGLVHGFGFASALGTLHLPRLDLGLALVGFNVGVEIGQSLVVAVVLPVLLWVRCRAWEPPLARAVSLLVAAVGSVWLLERLFFT